MKKNPMTKTMKVLSVTDILLTVFLMIVYIQFVMTQRHSNDGGWADLGFFLVLFVFLVSAVILTIPFIVISIRKQFKLERLLSFFSGVMRIKKRSKI